MFTRPSVTLAGLCLLAVLAGTTGCSRRPATPEEPIAKASPSVFAEFFARERVTEDGYLPEGAYEAAALHRDAMASAEPFFPTDPRFAMGGLWSYVGPRQLDDPSVAQTDPQLFPYSGRVNGVAHAPSNVNVHYVATAFGGVWRTNDRGASWTPLSDNWQFLHASSVAVRPNDSQTVLAGTGDMRMPFVWQAGGNATQFGIGIMRSTNGGNSWTNVAPQLAGLPISAIVYSTTNPNIVIAAQGSSVGAGPLLRSTASGALVGGASSFVACVQPNGTPVPNRNWQTIQVGTNAGGIEVFYAVATNGANPDLWQSTDLGATWTQIATPPAAAGTPVPWIATSATVPGRIYLYYSNGNGNAQFFFRNGNGAWQAFGGTIWDQGQNANVALATKIIQSNYNVHIGCLSTGGANPQDVIYIGNVGLYECAGPVAGNGNTFRPLLVNSIDNVTRRIHVDQHAFQRDPNNPTSAMIGNDGGVYRIAYAPAITNVANLNSNLGTTMFYHGAADANNSARLLGGTQDNGSPGSFQPGAAMNDWSMITTADGGFVAIHPANSNMQMTTQQGGTPSFVFTTDGWQTQTNIGQWQLPGGGGPAPYPFVVPIAFHPTLQGVALFGGTNRIDLWQQGVGWTGQVAGQALAAQVRSIAYDPLNPNLVYVGCTNGDLWRYNLAAPATANQIDNLGPTPLPGRSITSISPDPVNAGRVLVTVGGFAGAGQPGHVFELRPAAGGGQQWVPLDGAGAFSIPDIPVSDLKRDPGEPNVWYIATDVGVMMTPDGGGRWYNATAPLGMPNVHVMALSISTQPAPRLTAFTLGRGVWQIALGTPALESLTLDPATVVGGQTAMGRVRLTSPATVNSLVVLQADPAANVTLPGFVLVPSGQQDVEFEVVASPVAAPTDVVIRANRIGVTMEETLRIEPHEVASVTASRSPVRSGMTTRITVNLDRPTPVAKTVSLSSSHPAALPVPPNLAFAAGQQSAWVDVVAGDVLAQTAVTVGATLHFGLSQVVVDVIPTTLDAMETQPIEARGGANVVGRVYLTRRVNAPTTVRLVSSNPAIASVPADMVVAANALDGSFPVTVSGVNAETPVVITAILYGASVNTVFTALPTVLQGISFAPQNVYGGETTQMTVQLQGVAPAGGATVALASNSAAAPVPNSVLVPAGSNQATVPIQTAAVPEGVEAWITATYRGVERSERFWIHPQELETFFLQPASVTGGQTTTGRIELSGPAPAGGIEVALTSSDQVIQAPATVVVPAGESAHEFEIPTLPTLQSFGGWVQARLRNRTRTGNLTVIGLQSAALEVIPDQIVAGSQGTARITIAPAAPVGGITFEVRSSSSMASVPARVTVPAGANQVEFVVSATTQPTTSVEVSVTTKVGNLEVGDTFLLVPRVAQVRFIFSDLVSGSLPSKIAVQTRRLDGVVLGNLELTLDGSGRGSFSVPMLADFVLSAVSPRFLRKNTTINGAAPPDLLSIQLTNGDVNGDNTVNVADFLALRAAFGSTSSSTFWNPNADLDGNGSVGTNDFLILRRNFGRTGDS